MYLFLFNFNVHAHTRNQHKGSRSIQYFLFTSSNYAIYILLNVFAEIVYGTVESFRNLGFFLYDSKCLHDQTKKVMALVNSVIALSFVCVCVWLLLLVVFWVWWVLLLLLLFCHLFLFPATGWNYLGLFLLQLNTSLWGIISYLRLHWKSVFSGLAYTFCFFSGWVRDWRSSSSSL